MSANSVIYRQLRGYPAFLVFVATGLISLGSANSWLALDALPSWLAATFTIFAVIFGVISLPWLFKALSEPYRCYERRREQVRLADDAIESLTAQEAMIFWSMVAERRRHVFAQVEASGMDPAIQGLINRGLLQPQSPVGQGWTLRMAPHVHNMVADELDYAEAAVERLTVLFQQGEPNQSETSDARK